MCRRHPGRRAGAQPVRTPDVPGQQFRFPEELTSPARAAHSEGRPPHARGRAPPHGRTRLRSRCGPRGSGAPEGRRLRSRAQNAGPRRPHGLGRTAPETRCAPCDHGRPTPAGPRRPAGSARSAPRLPARPLTHPTFRHVGPALLQPREKSAAARAARTGGRGSRESLGRRAEGAPAGGGRKRRAAASPPLAPSKRWRAADGRDRGRGPGTTLNGMGSAGNTIPCRNLARRRPREGLRGLQALF
uniref:basic salivary proline-rich protein 4-like n=1 Tax=Odobenus rosmarus divergens TaxID=9708 RepID=UPI00063C2699|nr:PREDICTED: basic salivary proline-rich protein 4-like [Odobenus rosmarus divergens]